MLDTLFTHLFTARIYCDGDKTRLCKMSSADYYRILGIRRDATESDIKKA